MSKAEGIITLWLMYKVNTIQIGNLDVRLSSWDCIDSRKSIYMKYVLDPR